ncbi:hypothetical protein BDR04DRAFT_1185565 [Suillus decipiens]|nr:hypothetical protein BDR04DRAFT_1185565 [Suillus decipiens]
MDAKVVGDEGKLRSVGPTSVKTANNGKDAMWAVILTKKLWRKGIWCLCQGPDVRALYYRRKVNKKGRGDDKKLQKQLDAAKKVMGAHKLGVLSFYTYIVKYLTYHQLRVSSILVALAQSVHDLTSPDALSSFVQNLAVEFVHCGVGSKSYREVNPGMLKHTERGNDASVGMSKGEQPLPYGHSADAAVDIEGLMVGQRFLYSKNRPELFDSFWKSTCRNFAKRGQTMRITMILPPADFAFLNDLRMQAATKAIESGGGLRAKRKLATLENNKKAMQAEASDGAFISENDILDPRK